MFNVICSGDSALRLVTRLDGFIVIFASLSMTYRCITSPDTRANMLMVANQSLEDVLYM